ncbi:electron transport oxidoreductase, putative [Ixodes scapularis]|uniref:Electron transport oxidoreductase, putative n=1 Tax=Ixodes scapularis TaxID=6945 RepID=B7PAJ5_IXOSC|nr:electron transport oxidoreductase, putative [Ixodes scapularis]|eukprot:XP_002406914.1 electron transport oxidoreductase, putative [Ixodes scapularis]
MVPLEVAGLGSRTVCHGSDKADLLAEFGGLGLDYSYTVAFLEELAAVNAGGVVSGILVHTDMCTPALSRYGSDELRKQFLAPSIAGDLIGCVGVSEPDCGSDVASKLDGRPLKCHKCAVLLEAVFAVKMRATSLGKVVMRKQAPF